MSIEQTIRQQIDSINNYIMRQKWCDFTILEMSGSLKVGGVSSFENTPDIVIIFKEVFFIDCNYQWTTDTSKLSFALVSQTAAVDINREHAVEYGYHLFSITSEDVPSPFYVSAKNIYHETYDKFN